MTAPTPAATTGPRLAATRDELAALLADARSAGREVGLVPTMGALHEGHASLMTRARSEIGDGMLVVSVFVNPMQFGAGEDLDRYPRTLDADLEACARHGVDIVFAPAVEEMYPGSGADGMQPPQVTVEPGPVADLLEGRTRPGHFAGVLTVVAKLFGLVAPDVAVFGEKDYQQLVLLRRMAADLCLGVRVVGSQTRREDDGLALSSRNRYLGRDERGQAVALNEALRAAVEDARYGHDAAMDAARGVLRAAHGVDLDYLVITDPDLGELPTDVPAGTPGRVLIAARVGQTRLIDNMPLVLGAPPGRAHSGDTNPTETSEQGDS